MNDTDDHQPQCGERHAFVPTLDYVPPIADEVESCLTRAFARVEAMSPDELDLLVQQADQVEAERTAQRPAEA